MDSFGKICFGFVKRSLLLISVYASGVHFARDVRLSHTGGIRRLLFPKKRVSYVGGSFPYRGSGNARGDA